MAVRRAAAAIRAAAPREREPQLPHDEPVRRVEVDDAVRDAARADLPGDVEEEAERDAVEDDRADEQGHGLGRPSFVAA